MHQREKLLIVYCAHLVRGGRTREARSVLESFSGPGLSGVAALLSGLRMRRRSLQRHWSEILLAVYVATRETPRAVAAFLETRTPPVLGRGVCGLIGFNELRAFYEQVRAQLPLRESLRVAKELLLLMQLEATQLDFQTRNLHFRVTLQLYAELYGGAAVDRVRVDWFARVAEFERIKRPDLSVVYLAIHIGLRSEIESEEPALRREREHLLILQQKLDL